MHQPVVALVRETRPLCCSSIQKSVPLGRTGTPQGIANAAAFFVAEDVAHVTGQPLSVSGGITRAG
ncbi:MAG: SDR family oxidoreductase [Porticoccaceae bacterium]